MHLFTSKFVEKSEHVVELPGTVTTPAGFRAAGVAAGIKQSGKLDLGIIISDTPCSSAALYTKNAAAAAPITVSREAEQGGLIGAVVNSGSANACTGSQGIDDARAMAVAATKATGMEPGRLAVASTGVIGVPLPMDKVKAGIAQAAQELSEHGGGDFVAAIQTTDRIDKEGAVEVKLAGGGVHIGACAKGAGMIAPNMATMLTFITTDASVAPGLLHDLLISASASSFNAISVDGDMSTNDCVFLLANGQSGVAIEPKSADRELFQAALSAICRSLALKMVADGEGATKTVEFTVTGAESKEEAAAVAKAISGSPLVRTAFYGQDANWGRIMAAAGAALAGEPQLGVDIFYEGICLARAGAAGPEPSEQNLLSIMSQPEIAVTMDLHRGNAGHAMYFSDLTHDYVTLNAEYTT